MKRMLLLTTVLRSLAGWLPVVLPAIASAAAPENQTFITEVFRMSLDDWHHVPPAVRNDDRQLYEKCRAAVGQGKIERIDRIGGCVETGGSKTTFESVTEIIYGTGFTSNGKMLMPSHWETRNIGSTMECALGTNAGTPSMIQYEHDLQPVHWVPILDSGLAANVKRSEVPIFNTMRIMSGIPISSFAGPSLLGVVPIPASGEKATQLAILFALGNGSGKPLAPAASDMLLEVVILRGPSGGGTSDPSVRIQSLLARPGAVETTLAMPTLVGRKSSAESITEWMFPTSSSQTGYVVLPDAMDIVNQGSALQADCQSVAADACQIDIVLVHDLRKPVLPLVSGIHAGTGTSATPTRYRITLRERLNLVPGAWRAVKEIPLKPILGTVDASATMQSCHVFARIQVMGGGVLAPAGPNTRSENSAPEGFIQVPSGEFQMGNSLSGRGESSTVELPLRTIQVRPYLMAKHEVTKALWDEVREWGASHGYTDLPPGGGKASNHPVHSVSWYAMLKWCNARSEKEGYLPCYAVSGTVYREGSSPPDCNWSANGYRLPSEAEWEKAARGGLTGKRFPWGDTISHDRANFLNSGGEAYQSGSTGPHPLWSNNNNGKRPYTAPVGSFPPNGYGLYDMAGNVYELCWDWFGAYPATSESDPTGPSSGSNRVVRGGGWFLGAYHCRVARRYGNPPGTPYTDAGFRLARSTVP